MKLRAKMITSYVLLIALVFVIFYLVSMPLVRNYIRNRVSDGLEQEKVLIRTRMAEALEDVTDRESYLQTLARERIAIERLGLSSSLAIFYYNRATDTINFQQNMTSDQDTLDELKNRISDKDSSSFRGTLNGEPQTMLLFSSNTGNAQQRIFLLMYTPDTALEAFTRGFTRIMIIVFVVTAGIAVIISLIFAERITNPIAKLKKQALALKKRDFSAKSSISTNDEFRELSDVLNQTANELETYNTAQKEFLDNVSHELRTPLMSIQGYAEGIRDGIFESDEQTLGIIIGESVRLKNLVGNISYLSKLESTPDFYKFSKVNAGNLIKKAVDSISGLEQARSKKIVILSADEAILDGDPEKLTQLFVNILSNGLRYARSSVIVEAGTDSGFYVVKIKDDGPGIPEGSEEKIFRRFHKERGGNTGLGLAIALAIAKRHKGTISARNTSPSGALFTVALPLLDSVQKVAR